MKAAVIGTGNIAQKAHLPFFRDHEEVQLVAICGREPERTKAVAAAFGVPQFFTDTRLMLQTAKPEIVSVCSPNNLHFLHVLQCLDAGCHVLCEKPPAINYEQAQQMQAKAEEKGLVLAYNFQQRQLTEVAMVQDCIARNFFGKIYHVNATFIRRRGIPGWGNFTNKEVQGGGALIDIGVHVLDLALHLLNYPEPEAALGSTYSYIGETGGKGQFGEWNGSQFTVEDSCFAHLKLANDYSITLATAFALHSAAERNFSLEIFGKKGGAIFPPLRLFADSNGEAVITDCAYSAGLNPAEKNIEAFLAACKGKTTNVCTAREGAQLQKVVEEIYRSAARE